MSKNRKNKHWKKMISAGMAAGMAALSSMPVFAVYSPENNGVGSEVQIYNEYGAHMGLDEGTKNADISDIYSETYADDYLHAGAYIISDSPTTDKEYDPGVYYETDSFTYGDGIYVIIQDEKSPEKFYTMIKSTQNLAIGEEFIWREGDVGGRLLDDKYTSTHMAGNYKDSGYSYVSYDTSGGKLAAQSVEKTEDGTPMDEQEEGFTYLYLVSETAADFVQRTANEESGYEEKAQASERAYMPVNNSKSDASPFNNWSNLLEDDSNDYNDRIARIGGQEGDSNTRLYSYSGQNVIVAKFAVEIKEGVGELTWAEDTAYNENTDYTQTEGTITVKEGESKTLYFHTQYTNTWGRDGYKNVAIRYAVNDESVISYVGQSEEEDTESFVLTGLKKGTTTLTATLDSEDGKYAGGATVILTVIVE